MARSANKNGPSQPVALALAWAFALTAGFGLCILTGAAEEAAPAEVIELAADETADAGEPAGDEPEPRGPRKVNISGYLNAGFDGYWAGDSTDLNLDQYLRLDIHFPDHPKVHVHGGLWLHQDLDGDERLRSPLRDINDSHGSDFQARLMFLHADIDDLVGRSTLRIGRQRIVEGAAYNRIDGIYYKQRYHRWDWYAFLGARASIYENTTDEFVAGGGASVQATPTTRVALDVYYGEAHRSRGDEVYRRPLDRLLRRPYPRRVRRDIGDNVWALSVWQEITPDIRFFGRYSIEGGNADQLTLDLTGYVPSWDLTWHVSYRQLLNRVEDRVDDLTAFYRILGPYEEYKNVLVSVHKPVTERLTLSLEAQVHDSKNDALFSGNRDYERYAAILNAALMRKEDSKDGLDGMIAVERWNVSHGEGSWSISGELVRRWQAWVFTLGADYELYRDVVERYTPIPYWTNQALVFAVPGFYQGYRPGVRLTDTYRVRTREDIHSIYGKVRWAIDEQQAVTGRVTWEDDDGPEAPYWRLQVNYELRF